MNSSKSALVQDAAWASLAGSLYGGVILVGFALSLGAGPLVIGMLAAVPFIAQASQLPAIVLVERIRQRRKIALVSITLARVIILSLALIPYFASKGYQIPYLIVAEALIAVLGSIGGCALNSWLHQLLAQEILGAFFARRLFWATTLACIGSLVAGVLVDWWPFAERLGAYSFIFSVAAFAAFVSSWFLAKVHEPPMAPSESRARMVNEIRQPFRDRTFRSLLVFMGAWNIASNIALPFLAVYLIQQLGYALSVVTTLWVSSQVANALTIYLWGKLSDRFSNKAVLAVALPIYFLCVLGFVFAAIPRPHFLTMWMLYGLHIIMGAAAGGIGLATGNLGLKLAPQGKGTAYLAAISLVGAVAGGLAPILGGALAEWFKAYELSFLVRWISPQRTTEFTMLAFAHWEFLFLISALLGLYVLHALSKIREGQEHSERVVMQQFALEAVRTVNHLSSIGGLLGVLSIVGRIVDRRRRARYGPS
jgi:MFS family permease